MKKPEKPRRLAADRRYAAPTDAAPPSGGGLPPQQAQRRAAAAPPRKPRRGNFVTRGVTGAVSLTWRIIWGSFWRTGATLALILGLTVAYYYSTLPDPQALFDGRARGSVTIEQVIWAGAVILIVGIVVAAISAYVTSEAGKIK